MHETMVNLSGLPTKLLFCFMASNMRYYVFNLVCSCETLILIRAVLQPRRQNVI